MRPTTFPSVFSVTLLPGGLLRICAALLLISAEGLGQEASAPARVSFFGYEINQPRWRSTDVSKTIILAQGGTAKDPDGSYGSLGWIFPALVSDADLPPFVASDYQPQETLIYKSPTYADDFDDPTQSPRESAASIQPDSKAIAYQNPGKGEEALLYQLKLTKAVPPSFLVGIAFGNLAHPQETPFGTASYRAAIANGPTTAQLPAIANDGVIDWIFIRVDGATAGDVVNIFGTGGANGMASIALITFDPVP